MKIRNLILGAMIFVGTLNAAEIPMNKMNARSMAKLALAQKYTKSPNTIMDIQKVNYPYAIQNNQLYVHLLLQVSGAEVEIPLKKLGCEIMSHTTTIYAVKAPANKIAEISALNSVKMIEASQKYTNNLDVSKKAINAENVTAEGLTTSNIIGGEGVVVGIYDTGLDLTHPDFSNANGTRVLKLWDMSDTSNSGPDGYENYKWGKEYTKAAIDAGVGAVAEVDILGHGTHVAGTSAGGGVVDTKFKGIAYNSDLIVVKGVKNDEKGSFTNEDIIAGCDYIIKEAQKLNKPVVINMSLGGIMGSHDGKSLLSLAVSEMSKPGVVFSIAGGNEGQYPIHSGGAVEANSIVEFPIYPQNICELIEDFDDFCETPNAYMTAADLWYSKDAVDSVYLVAYKMQSMLVDTIPIIVAKRGFSLGESVTNEEFLTDDGVPIAMISYNTATPNISTNDAGNFGFYIHNNGDPNFRIGNYIWSIAVKTKNQGTVDMWGGIAMLPTIPFAPFMGTKSFICDYGMIIGSPGDADSAICVGSFTTKNSWKDSQGQTQNNDWVVGDISDFSSRGPSRDGRVLPLITAPGQIIFAAKSKDYIASNGEILVGRKYVGMSGTSMATPHVTGAIALMLQINPKLGYTEIADILTKTAVKDEFTGSGRNNTFGLGKINVQAAIDYLMGKSGVDYVYANDVKVYPNPAVNSINFELSNEIKTNDFSISIFNSAGNQISDKLNYQLSGSKLNLDLSNFISGVYNAECRSGNTVSKFRFVVK